MTAAGSARGMQNLDHCERPDSDRDRPRCRGRDRDGSAGRIRRPRRVRLGEARFADHGEVRHQVHHRRQGRRFVPDPAVRCRLGVGVSPSGSDPGSQPGHADDLRPALSRCGPAEDLRRSRNLEADRSARRHDVPLPGGLVLGVRIVGHVRAACRSCGPSSMCVHPNARRGPWVPRPTRSKAERNRSKAS